MAKPPSWNEIRANAQEFATRWEGTTDENAEAQSFWNEFLGIFGVDRKRVASFEARAKRTSTGGRGRIDLFWPGTLVAEHKSAGKDLGHAEEQALDYLESLDIKDFPGVILTSDFSNLRIRDLGGDNEPFTVPLEKLADEIDRFAFIAGYKKRSFGDAEEEAANVTAAKLMASLYEELSRNGYEGHDASVLMTRILFLVFGDDTGMWEKGLFGEFVESRTNPDGSDLGPQLAMLFQILDKAEDSRPTNSDELLLRFPYVNGALFSARIDIPTFDRAMRDELLRCCAFDWALISPAVFGSLFQAVKSKEARRVLGEHYTTEQNILRLLSPLFLDELNAAFESSKHSVQKLEKLHDRLAEITVFDPACGCGNFLIIAYRELRRLELNVLKRISELEKNDQLVIDATDLVRVRLSSFYGIELEEWPARIAETGMFLVDQQANHELARVFGQAPDRLPILNAANITVGNALRIDWNDVLSASDCSYVVGNPPFVGTRLQTDEQKSDQQHVWKGAPKAALTDFVTNWFVLASRYISNSRIAAAFVATNSITQGEQASLLWHELGKSNVEIEFAHRTFAWSSEAPGAANVHVVIIGIGGAGLVSNKRLFEYPDIKAEPVERTAKFINAYLIDGPNVLVNARRTPISSAIPPMTSGNKPRDGGFISNISDEEAKEIQRNDPVASKYLRRILGSQEHLHGEVRWCLWLLEATPAEIRSSPELRKRVSQVLAERTGAKSDKGRAADRPSLFSSICQPDTDYLLVPSVSSETRRTIPVGYYTADDIVTNAVFFIANADLKLFGLLSSSMFTAWVETVSSRLESRYQISATAVYNTFPFPVINQSQAEHLASAAERVLEVRTHFPDSTLADLYDPLVTPVELLDAHRDLDVAVDALYTGRRLSTTAERLELLFARYAELTADLLSQPTKSKKAK
jgi:hypothetical protein